MFQHSDRRKRHDDTDLCVDCIHDADCTVKPEMNGWRFVLSYCQSFMGKLGSKRKNDMTEED